jgi:hypothetical protein
MIQSESQSGRRAWFAIAVILSVCTILDLLVIIVESVANDLPHSVRCQLVNAALSLPFDNEYKSKEEKVRRITKCSRAL